MIVLPLQWDSHRGPDAVGQHKFTFTLDESVSSDFYEILRSKKGTTYITVLIQADTKEAEEFSTETKEQTRERFRKHMNALINQITDTTGNQEFRTEFKEYLHRIGRIKESTNELDIDGYAFVITELKRIQNG